MLGLDGKRVSYGKFTGQTSHRLYCYKTKEVCEFVVAQHNKSAMLKLHGELIRFLSVTRPPVRGGYITAGRMDEGWVTEATL